MMHIIRDAEMSSQLNLLIAFIQHVFRVVLKSKSYSYLIKVLPIVKKYSEFFAPFFVFFTVVKTFSTLKKFPALDSTFDDSSESSIDDKRELHNINDEESVAMSLVGPDVAELSAAQSLSSSVHNTANGSNDDDDDDDSCNISDNSCEEWQHENIPYPKVNKYIVTDTSIIVNRGLGFVEVYDKWDCDMPICIEH